MKTCKMTIASALLTAAAQLAPLVAAAATFKNGSFESPSFGLNGMVDINSLAQAPIGWDPGGTLGNSALFYESNGNFGVVAKDGVNMIGFGGNGTTGATLSQTFDTAPGTSYAVNYFVTAQQLGSGPQSYIAEVFAGATGLGSQSNSIADTAFNWIGHSFSFVALSTSSTLRFTDTSNGAAAVGINWALDAVSVTAVPEAGAFALMGTGLAAVAFLFRVRRKS